MLRGDDDRDDLHRAAVLILDRDLALAVGTGQGQRSALAKVAQAPGEPVGQHDGKGHHLGRLPAGVAEHHTLVAGSLILGLLAIDALGDVLSLMIQADQHGAGLAVDLVRGTGMRY